MTSATYERTGIVPKRDWLVMLATATCAVLALAVASYLLYLRVDAGTLFSVPTGTTGAEPTINAGLLQTTVNAINLKQTNADALDQASSTPADPSL